MNLYKQINEKLDNQSEIIQDLKESVDRLTDLLEHPPDGWGSK